MNAKLERDKELAIALLKGAGVVTDAHRFAPIGRSRFCTVVKESEYLQKWRKVAGAGTLLQKIALCREIFGGDESGAGELRLLLDTELGGFGAVLWRNVDMSAYIDGMKVAK